jgi:MFS family permease
LRHISVPLHQMQTHLIRVPPEHGDRRGVLDFTVAVGIAMSEIAAHYGRRPTIMTICLASVSAMTAGGPVAIVLPLLVLVQITSFADVGALGAGAVSAADPAQRGAALALYALAGFATGSLGPVAVGTVLDVFGGVANATTAWMIGFLTISLGSEVAAGAVWYAPD